MNEWHFRYLTLCVDKCFNMLVVLPPLHDIAALHKLHFALLASFLVKWSQAFNHFNLSAIVLELLLLTDERDQRVACHVRST